MTGPHPVVAAVRLAVRSLLCDLDPGSTVLVACSGGADSLALASAVAFEAPKLAVRAGAVVVDHGLQAGSADIARRASQQCRALGLDPVEVVPVSVDPGVGGPEAAARSARYAALDEAAGRLGAELVLLGHTRDDQAEQVLLGLARGSGARSLSGMPARRGRYARPLLHLSRAQTAAACAASGLEAWEDPHNADPAYARVRARSVMPALEAALGPGVAAALARTADRLREDADHLDALAGAAATALGEGPFAVSDLHAVPRAVRTRAWRLLLVAAGAPAGQLAFSHVEACDALLTRWHGQGPISVPGPVAVTRSGGRVSIAARSRVE
ncbi:tRNA lysidine(34) synthetase TilS [Knoellia sp. 3-2P3]|uniref:tRNA lysidine(34) synthetase TilS n=1 Tax=unclassified Knoellia TaxID=2618719 RepID=UPI0023DB38FA|nr:tRNA lysidine(34) synthetase TilS [Knoellia sp. 3-2P3]MDF2090818.1 tRNA lysidine(34) synthetase TilS [Knoellia sp. 3-2P3]